MRKFEPWFDEMRTNKSFRMGYEVHVADARSRGVKPENPKTWAYDCFQAIEEEKEARARMERASRASRRRAVEVTSAIVKYEDYPT